MGSRATRALAEHPEVSGLVQQALDAANAHDAKVERVERFAILGHALTQETGELTPTQGQAQRRL